MDVKVLIQSACGNFITMFVGVVLAFYFLFHPALRLVGGFLEALTNFGSGWQ